MKKDLLFSKALDISRGNKVYLVAEGNNRFFFRLLGKVDIEMHITKGGRQFKCNCKHCSIHSISDPFCSYQAALIHYLVKKDGKHKWLKNYQVMKEESG